MILTLWPSSLEDPFGSPILLFIELGPRKLQTLDSGVAEGGSPVSPSLFIDESLESRVDELVELGLVDVENFLASLAPRLVVLKKEVF